MAGNILEQITEQYHSLTRSGKKLADYIFSNTHDAQYLSISNLAEYSNVSEASITRFCRSLGLSGYNDLKLELAKASYLTDLGDPLESSDTITSEDTAESIFNKLHAANILSLNETMELLDENEIFRAVDLLSSAERVFCFGQGGSMVMAMEAWARFSTATSRFVHIEDSHMQVMNIALASEKDVILFFSYSGSTKDMEDIMRIAKKRHVSVILITHFPKSRATEFADVVLLCGYNESPLQSGSVAAKLGQLFLIECLFLFIVNAILKCAPKHAPPLLKRLHKSCYRQALLCSVIEQRKHFPLLACQASVSLLTYSIWMPVCNRVGEIFSPLSHHRTCRSAYGGST